MQAHATMCSSQRPCKSLRCKGPFPAVVAAILPGSQASVASQALINAQHRSGASPQSRAGEGAAATAHATASRALHCTALQAVHAASAANRHTAHSTCRPLKSPMIRPKHNGHCRPRWAAAVLRCKSRPKPAGQVNRLFCGIQASGHT